MDRYKRTYNPCDECGYSYSKNGQEMGECKICEFNHYIQMDKQGRLVEQKNGIWIKKHNEKAWTHYTYSCSICDGGSDCDTNYCPNCGAKMITKEKAEAKLAEEGGADDE